MPPPTDLGPSRWDTGATRSAWFTDAAAAVPRACHVDGWSFLKRLQAELVFRVGEAGGSLPGLGGRPVTAADVPDADAWDAATLRGLYAAAAAAHAPPDALAAVAADAGRPAGAALRARTLQTAIWLTDLSHGTRTAGGVEQTAYDVGSPDRVGLSAGDALVPPVLGRSLGPPHPTVDSPTCAPVPGGVTAGPARALGAPRVAAWQWGFLAVVAVAVLGAGVLTRDVPTGGTMPRSGRGRRPRRR